MVSTYAETGSVNGEDKHEIHRHVNGSYKTAVMRIAVDELTLGYYAEKYGRMKDYREAALQTAKVDKYFIAMDLNDDGVPGDVVDLAMMSDISED